MKWTNKQKKPSTIIWLCLWCKLSSSAHFFYSMDCFNCFTRDARSVFCRFGYNKRSFIVDNNKKKPSIASFGNVTDSHERKNMKYSLWQLNRAINIATYSPIAIIVSFPSGHTPIWCVCKKNITNANEICIFVLAFSLRSGEFPKLAKIFKRAQCLDNAKKLHSWND